MAFPHKGALAPILTLLSLMLLAGCGGGSSPAPSGSYPTSSIYAYMKAVQDESGNVSTTVQLRDGPLDTARYLYLSSGESLYSSLDVSPQQYMNFSGNLFSNSLEVSQRVKVMASRDLYIDNILFNQIISGKPEYFSLDTPPSASSSPVRVYVDFERAGNVLGGESTIELPQAFQILTPTGNASISRATPIVLSWTNVDPTSTMQLNVAGVCTDNSRYSQSYLIGTDTGSATLNSTNYFPTTINATISCHVAFMLQRVRIGGVSLNFAAGGFTGIQQRTVQFTSTP